MTIKPKEFYLPFIKREKIAKDTYSFYFDPAKGGLDFLPGQYIRMTLEIENPDSRGNSRFFTIASSPLIKDYIMITTKIIHPAPDGAGQSSSFKKKLLELKTGDNIKFFGPMGGFILDEREKVDKVFLAGGIGITPFHSMITYASKKNLKIPITLFVSFSRVKDLIFFDELSNIDKENSFIKIIYTITHPDSPLQWKGEIGRISDTLIKRYVKNIFKSFYYIVGPPRMVVAIEEVVKNMGVENKRVFIENFTGY